MDYEDVGNLSNMSFNEDITPSSSMNYLTQEIIFTIFCTVAVFADIALIYTLLNFKRMRTVPNTLLLNWAIADIICLIVTPSGYRILSILDNISLPEEFFCFLFQIGASLHVTIVLLVMLLSIDWCIAAYFQKVSENFRNYYRFYLAVIWVIALLLTSVTCGFCIRNVFLGHIQTLTVFFSYMGLLLFIIILNVVRFIKRCRNNPVIYSALMLNLATVFVLSWFVAFLSIVVMTMTRTFHVTIEMTAMSLVFCTSIFVFVIIYYTDKDFQACFLQVLKRKRNKYEEADFDFHNPTRKPIIKNPACISFNKKHELLTDVY